MVVMVRRYHGAWYLHNGHREEMGSERLHLFLLFYTCLGIFYLDVIVIVFQGQVTVTICGLVQNKCAWLGLVVVQNLEGPPMTSQLGMSKYITC